MVDFGVDLIGLHINGTARSVTGTQTSGSSGAALRLHPACPSGKPLTPLCPEHVKDQPPAGGGGVDVLLHRLEAHSPALQLTDDLDRCGNDRPSRSNRHTTNVPLGRSDAITSPKAARSVVDPDAVSVHVRQHPAALSASCCSAGSCTVGDTLA